MQYNSNNDRPSIDELLPLVRKQWNTYGLEDFLGFFFIYGGVGCVIPAQVIVKSDKLKGDELLRFIERSCDKILDKNLLPEYIFHINTDLQMVGYVDLYVKGDIKIEPMEDSPTGNSTNRILEIMNLFKSKLEV